MPSHEKLVQRGKYPIEYYDEHFVSWGEIHAAARTTGMAETRLSVGNSKSPAVATQLSLGLEETA